MSKKNVSLVSLIFLFIFGVFLFLPCNLTQVYWKADTPGVGIYTRSWSMNCSFFHEPINSLAIVLILLTIIGTVALVFHYINKQHRFLKIATFAPTAMVMVFVILSIVAASTTTPNGEPAGTATLGYYGHFSYSFAWGYYIAAALLIVPTILSIALAMGHFEDRGSQNESNSALQQITQLKELLDSGVITQEEFDAKKKQLLGLYGGKKK